MAANYTYLWLSFFILESTYETNHVTSFLLSIFPQLWPGNVHRGTGAYLLIFTVKSSGYNLPFSNPALGCSPLPLKSVGGSSV